jgi:hypothetical protein
VSEKKINTFPFFFSYLFLEKKLFSVQTRNGQKIYFSVRVLVAGGMSAKRWESFSRSIVKANGRVTIRNTADLIMNDPSTTINRKMGEFFFIL